MNNRNLNLVDVDLRNAAKDMLSTTLTKENLSNYRDNVLSHAKAYIPHDLEVIIEDKYIPHTDFNLHAIIIRPKKVLKNMPAYLYMHGGGMVSGAAHLDNTDNAQIAHELQCVVVSVDYRLAPETIFPGQLEDCYTVLKWMNNNADKLNIDTSRIVVGGNSAGGALAASLSQLALDRGEVNIAFQNLHIPMLDAKTVTENQPNKYTGDFGWTRSMNKFAWEMYLGHEIDNQTLPYYASPASRNSFEGLPPTLITIGSLDLFVDEALNYAQRLMHEGVPTEIHVYPGLYHLGELVPNSRVKSKLMKDRLNALNRAFYG
ncbi:alpha/beta hydrolase [Staphylococcus epidermidis]|nr:alpha/beta hydrolase [Staphylococcus epidermidis]